MNNQTPSETDETFNVEFLKEIDNNNRENMLISFCHTFETEHSFYRALYMLKKVHVFSYNKETRSIDEREIEKYVTVKEIAMYALNTSNLHNFLIKKLHEHYRTIDSFAMARDILEFNNKTDVADQVVNRMVMKWIESDKSDSDRADRLFINPIKYTLPYEARILSDLNKTDLRDETIISEGFKLKEWLDYLDGSTILDILRDSNKNIAGSLVTLKALIVAYEKEYLVKDSHTTDLMDQTHCNLVQLTNMVIRHVQKMQQWNYCVGLPSLLPSTYQ